MSSFGKFLNIVAFGFGVLTLLTIYSSYATENDSTMVNDQQNIIAIIVEPNALGPNLPDEAILVNAGKEMLQKHFKNDMSMSQRVRGNIALTKRDALQYELTSLFLYKQSYTAVEHIIIFTLSGNHYTVISAK